jgi:hypothetical protein
MARVALVRDPVVPVPPVRRRIPRAVWHAIGLILAVLLAYAIWRGYQSPDFLLDLSALRLC